MGALHGWRFPEGPGPMPDLRPFIHGPTDHLRTVWDRPAGWRFGGAGDSGSDDARLTVPFEDGIKDIDEQRAVDALNEHFDSGDLDDMAAWWRRHQRLLEDLIDADLPDLTWPPCDVVHSFPSVPDGCNHLENRIARHVGVGGCSLGERFGQAQLSDPLGNGLCRPCTLPHHDELYAGGERFALEFRDRTSNPFIWFSPEEVELLTAAWDVLVLNIDLVEWVTCLLFGQDKASDRVDRLHGVHGPTVPVGSGGPVAGRRGRLAAIRSGEPAMRRRDDRRRPSASGC